MPNPWTGKGNPYTRKEVVERLRATLKKGGAIIAAGAGTGISGLLGLEPGERRAPAGRPESRDKAKRHKNAVPVDWPCPESESDWMHWRGR